MYTTAKAMSKARQVKLINKHKFVIAVLDKAFQTFVVQ